MKKYLTDVPWFIYCLRCNRALNMGRNPKDFNPIVDPPIVFEAIDKFSCTCKDKYLVRRYLKVFKEAVKFLDRAIFRIGRWGWFTKSIWFDIDKLADHIHGIGYEVPHRFMEKMICRSGTILGTFHIAAIRVKKDFRMQCVIYDEHFQNPPEIHHAGETEEWHLPFLSCAEIIEAPHRAISRDEEARRSPTVPAKESRVQLLELACGLRYYNQAYTALLAIEIFPVPQVTWGDLWSDDDEDREHT